VRSPPSCTTAQRSESACWSWDLVVAVRDDVVDRRSDAVVRSFVQAEQHVFGRVFNSHVVLRELALRRDELDGAGMRELREPAVGAWDLDVAKADCLGESVRYWAAFQ